MFLLDFSYSPAKKFAGLSLASNKLILLAFDQKIIEVLSED